MRPGTVKVIMKCDTGDRACGMKRMFTPASKRFSVNELSLHVK
jgi:hypothetical protein